MKMSPLTRKVLNLASSAIQACLDILAYQLILSSVLLLLGESIIFEARVFSSGIIVVCFTAGSLYGFGVLRKPFAAEKASLAKTGVLLVFLNVLFSVTTEYTVPLASMILSLALFFAASFFFRYSLRHVLARKIFRVPSAGTI